MNRNEMKRLRNSLELSQEDFARMLGIARTHYNRLERGKKKLHGSVKLLAEQLAQKKQ